MPKIMLAQSKLIYKSLWTIYRISPDDKPISVFHFPTGAAAPQLLYKLNYCSRIVDFLPRSQLSRA